MILRPTGNKGELGLSDRGYEYVFSVVMAVYNSEPFLREALDSIVNQNKSSLYRYENGNITEQLIPPDRVCQVIMVDDGSTDGSGKICDEYAEKYEGFTVIHKKNGGVSSARNEGMRHVRGKYMNFLDSDDKLSPGVFTNIYNFFERHYDETDIVTVPLVFFDAVSGPHWQNYKFTSYARIANLYCEYDCPLMFVNASFFKSEYKDRVSFNKNLVCGEDIRFICEIISEKMTLGLMPYCHYKYRRRSVGEESIIQSVKKKRGWYFDYFKHLIFWAVSFSKRKWGYIPAYFQNLLICDLKWRFRDSYEDTARAILTECEYKRYKKLLFGSLRHFDDAYIIRQREIWAEHKCMMLIKKHGKLPRICPTGDDARLMFDNTPFVLLSSCYTKYSFIELGSGRLTVEGVTTVLGILPDERVECVIELSEGDRTVLYECENIPRDTNKYRLDEVMQRGISFRAEIPLSEVKDRARLLLSVRIGDARIVKKDIRYGIFCKVSNEFKNSYFYKDGFAVTCDGYYIDVIKCRGSQRAALEAKYRRELRRSDRLGAKKAAFARFAVMLYKRIFRKPLWIITDRVSRAGDNGEALFRYLKRKRPRGIRFFFAVERGTPDYKRLKPLGSVVDRMSYRYKLLHLAADVIISSHADDGVHNPFFNYFAPYRDMLNSKKLVFLQHGVTKDDMSGWLNRYNKNFSGFVCAAEREAESVLTGDYFYDEKSVWLTGFARFDRLYEGERRYITVMPTWRMYLSRWDSGSVGKWNITDKFMDSEYFRFYNKLLNDERIIMACKRAGYTLAFMPHPNVMPYISLFTRRKDVVFFDVDTEYRDVYAESALVVTDYSSAAFDFAYLYRPVIYTQFDSDEFFSGSHVYTKGYFDYLSDGFGDVTYSYEKAVVKIIECIDNGCTLEDKYRERINNFFAFHDKCSSERIYKKILEL